MKNQENKELGFTPLYISGVIILFIIVVTPVIIYFSFDSWTDRGTFGDLFGIVNALFSGLAFAGIIYTILLQRSELKLQRQELTETRIELKRSADAQEKSEKAFIKQIDAMNQTAKINGLNSIVEFYNSQAQSKVTAGYSGKTELKEAATYVNKIIKIMNIIEENDKTKGQKL